MLKTVYSNAYEILEAYLSTEISLDKNKAQDPFERVRVISSSGAINNRLRQHLAKTNGICSGIDFWTTQSWFHNYAGIGVGDPDEAQDFLWVIWSVLDNEFISRFERLQTFFSHYTTDAERALARYELAGKVATVFDKYVNYRFDWVAHWMGLDQINPVGIYEDVDDEKIRKEKAALEAHPDYAWQKAIWEKLSETTVWAGRDTLRLYASPESLAIKFANEPEALHFFAPSGISPLMLPVIKMLSESGHRVYVYLLNPCVEYWFESFADTSNEKALHYLRKNAASTRALINRFWTFTPEGEENVDHKPAKLGDLTHVSLQKLNIWTQSETERLDLIATDNTLLHQAQKAILQNCSDLLPQKLDPDDQSIRFIEAPTLTREVQNAINMIQAFFADKSLGLKPEDVLIITPEIEKTAPVFEACMQALPPEYRMDYQIMGNSSAGSDLTAKSLVDLGKLLIEGLTLPKLNAWLELPMVCESLGLSLDDLNVLHDWLVSAGFRDGINSDHFRFTHPGMDSTGLNEAEDGTLERAIERLSWGYVYAENQNACPADILPVQCGLTRYADIAENKALFLKLCKLSEKLRLAFESMTALGKEALPADLSLWAHRLIDDFFAKNTNRISLMNLRSCLRVQEFALTTVPEPITMPLTVYWRALEDRIATPDERYPAVGRITLAGMQTFRGLPFKVIIAIGMDENSGFPGNQRFEEFDLMGSESLKRQNDRDSRSDNRNVFLDAFLSARDRFVCSYCVGSDKKAPLNPSPVVVDLMDLLTTNALNETDETLLQAKARMGEALTASITLTDTAVENFTSNTVRFWKSFQTHTLNALEKARKEGYQNVEPVMLTGPIAANRISDTLYLEDLLAFYSDPVKWVQKRLDFQVFEAEIPESVPVITEKNSLQNTLIRLDLMNALQEGLSVKEIEKRFARDPLKGTPAVRVLSFANEISKARQTFELKNEIMSLARAEVINKEINLKSCEPVKRFLLEDVTLFHFDSNVSSESLPFLANIKSDVGYLIEACASDSAQKRAFVKMAALAAADCPVGLITLDLKGDSIFNLYEAPDTSCARTFIDSFAKLIALQIEKGCAMTSSSDYNNMEPILWRGRDYEKVKALSKAFFGAADKLIAPVSINPEKKAKSTKGKSGSKPSSRDNSEKKLNDFGTKFDNLVSGESYEQNI